MKKLKLIPALLLLILNSTFLIQHSSAQCLQIESILVDACVSGGGCTSASGPCSCEGRNEMVLFRVGGTAINTTSLTPTWPNNSFKGWKQNANTASNVATLNATIVKCGFLKEPVGNILPANSEVLIITSWDICTGANSFANLQDTLIVLFQDTNNFQGHFVNQNNGGTVSATPSGPVLNRTLTLSYPPLACSEAVTYHPHLLVNNMGTYGGSSGQNDGATVLFDAAGNDTYINIGCTAPYIPIQVAATAPSTVCVNATASLNGTVDGPATTYTWSTSGTGTVSVPTGTLTGSGASSTTLTPTYTPGTNESGTITFTLTAQGKCTLAVTTTTVSINVIALPSPTVTSSNGAAICNGNSTVLSVNSEAGVSYSWNPGAASGTSFTVTPGSQTIYTATATNSCAAIDATFTVDVNALPTVSVASASVCPGFTATITASGAVTYTWSTSAVGSSISDAPANTTQYTVTGTDGNGCVNIAIGTIVVYNSPTVTVNSPAVCIGGTVTLNAGGASTYTWSTAQNGNSISDNPSTNTSYTVTGTDANGCDNFAVSTVTVNALPTVTANSATICPGNSATLTGNGATTYTWSTGASGVSITETPTVSPTNYTVTGTDANGCVNTGTTSITIVNSLTVTSIPTATVICNGSSTTITGSGASTYTWSPSGSLSSSNGGTVTASPTVATTYTVVGSSGSCKDSSVVTINVNNLPSVGAASTASVVCTGTSVTLTGSGAATYTWTGGVTDGVSFTPASTQTYTVTGTDVNGCTNTANVTVTVSNLTITAVPTNTAICAAQSTTITANGATNYTWSPAATLSSSTGTSVTASPTIATTYTVIGISGSCSATTTVTINVNTPPTITANTSTTSVCAGGSVTLTGGGGIIYVWTGGVSNGIPFTPSVTATYSVAGLDFNGCSNLAAVTVTVNPLPTVTANSSTICVGQQTATLTANGASNYTWSPALGLSSTTGSVVTATPVASTTYVVTGTDANGCVDTFTASVTLNSLPPIVVTPSVSVCPGATATLTASGAATYTWSTAQTGSSITVPGTAASYTVVGTNTVTGCFNSAVSVVSLSSLPSPQAISGNTVVCQGFSTPLSVASGAYTYSWSGPGVSGSNSSVNASQAGVYTLTATNSCGSASSTFTVSVSSPIAAFTPSVYSGQVPTSVVFINNSIGTALGNYWNLGNSDTSTQVSPGETYSQSGTYNVILTVTDAYGCKDTASAVIIVTDVPLVVVIPNVFTPNGDNINELFMITGTGIDKFNCKIYDRWGIFMYEWSDIKGGWDGKNTNGKDVTDGTYYYILSYSDIKSKAFTRQGYLQLIH